MVKIRVCALLMALSVLLLNAALAEDDAVLPRYSYESVCVPVAGTPFMIYLPAVWYLYTPPEDSDIVFAAGVQDKSKWLFVQAFPMTSSPIRSILSDVVWLDGDEIIPSLQIDALCGLSVQPFVRDSIHATGVVIRDTERETAYLVQVMTDGDAAFAALGVEVISSICLAQ